MAEDKDARRRDSGLFDPNDIAEKSLVEIIELARNYERALDSASVECAIIGESGTGKSSLINAIAGEHIAAVGETETTQEAQRFHSRGIDYVDLPGCGTAHWPIATYIDQLDLARYDMFILNLGNRVKEDEIRLFDDLCRQSGKPCFVTRNFMDLALDNERHDNGLSAEQAADKIRTALESAFPDHADRIYLISNRFPTRWDFPRLLDELAGSMPGIKRDKAVAGMAALTDEGLALKREVARKRVNMAAALSAGSSGAAIGPLAVVGIASDIGSMLKLCKRVRSIYGLGDEQLRQLERANPGLSNRADYQAVKKQIATMAANRGTVAGIRHLLMTQFGKKAPSTLARFVPVVGQAVGMSTAYVMTRQFGLSYVDKCHEQATDIVRQAYADY